jgi:hypothetical protein
VYARIDNSGRMIDAVAYRRVRALSVPQPFARGHRLMRNSVHTPAPVAPVSRALDSCGSGKHRESTQLHLDISPRLWHSHGLRLCKGCKSCALLVVRVAPLQHSKDSTATHILADIAL